MTLPTIEVLQICVFPRGLILVWLEDGTAFRTEAIERHEDKLIFFEIKMPTGVFQGKQCLLQPKMLNRFKSEPYDNAW